MSSAKEVNMKVTVFGATGKIGRLVVSQALEQGHKVIAFARNPEKVANSHEKLQVMKGDALDYKAVKKAVEGTEGVVTTLGTSPLAKEKLRATSAANIIRAMHDTGVKRFVCLSGLGAGDSFDLLPFHYKYIIVPLLARRLRTDLQLQENHVMNSQLDWIIVRPAIFVNGKHTGIYRHGIHLRDKPPAFRISHHDVADFIVKQLVEDTYLHQTPAISY